MEILLLWGKKQIPRMKNSSGNRNKFKKYNKQQIYHLLMIQSIAELNQLRKISYSTLKNVYILPLMVVIRTFRDQDLERLDPDVRRIMNSHVYLVSLPHQLLD